MSACARWGDAITGFSSWMRIRGLSSATVRMRRDLLRYLAAAVGATRPDTLTRAQLLAFVSGRAWSVEYRRSVYSTIKAFYGYALTQEIVSDDISDVLPRVKTAPFRARPVDDGAWEAAMAAAPARTRLMVRLAGEAGLRRAEVARLHSRDLGRDGYGFVITVRGKGDRERQVPITDGLAADLAACPAGWIFPNPQTGEPLSARYVGILVSRLLPDGVSMHRLRHRYASRGYAGTHDIRAVQEALGHASVATTQRYTYVSSRDIRAVTLAASPLAQPIADRHPVDAQQ